MINGGVIMGDFLRRTSRGVFVFIMAVLLLTVCAFNISAKETDDNSVLRWGIIGDSLSERVESGVDPPNYTDKFYYEIIAEKYNVITDCVAVRGSGYKRNSGNTFIDQIDLLTGDYDIVTVFGSGNDMRFYDENLHYGTINDEFTTIENSTVYACARHFIEKFSSDYPNTKLVIFSPTAWNGYNYPQLSSNPKMYWYNEMLKELCEAYQIPFVDMYTNSGFIPSDEEFRNKYTVDGTHPNTAGHEFFYGMFEEALLSYMDLKTSDTSITSISAESVTNESENSILISEIKDVVKLTGVSARPEKSGIVLEKNDNYDTYYFVSNQSADIYIGKATSYTAIAYGNNYSGIEPHSNFEILLASNSVRYRTIEQNLPYEKNKLSIVPGDIIAVTIRTSNDMKIFGYNSVITTVTTETENNNTNDNANDNIELAPIHISEKSPKVVYKSDSSVSNSSERLQIYIPAALGYVRYDFVHSKSVTANSDIWRVNNAFACTDSLGQRYSLTAGGEWEVAVHLENRDDFSGGILHGDQKAVSVLIIVDGTVVEPSQLTSIRDFKELRIVTTSNLYDPADGTTIIAEDGCEHLFTSEGLTIKQSLIWQKAETISNCYLAMFPIKKSLAANYYTDSDFKTKSITGNQSISDAQSIILYSNNTGVTGEFSIIRYPDIKQLYITDNGGGAYNKCYYVIKHSGSVTNGTKWQSEVKYNFAVSK